MEKKIVQAPKEIPDKHKHIFIFYSELLAYNGESARYYEKKYFYQEVARQFYLNKYYVAWVIRELLRKEYKPTQEDYRDYILHIRSTNLVMAGYL